MSDSGTIANVVEYSLSMHSTVEPFSTSNGYEYCEERASIEVELRVQDDGGSDRLVSCLLLFQCHTLKVVSN